MGCGRNDDSNDNRRDDNCICEVVRAIKRVQDIRDDRDCDDCSTDCFLTPLGALVSPSRQRANTRVFMLLTKDGDPFKAMFTRENKRGRGRDTVAANSSDKDKDNNGCFSVFFRVQNVFDNCCATLEVLEPRNGRHGVNLIKHGKIDFDALCDVDGFEATGSCITVDLKCFCGIQCVRDVFIDCDED